LLIFVIILAYSQISSAGEGEYEIVIGDNVIEAGKQFSVTILYNGSSAPGVDVNIGSGADVPGYTTKEDGVAYFMAPDRPGDYTITAMVDGKNVATTSIKVVSEPGFWESPFFPIVVATICLIGAIVFVNLRQKNEVFTRAKEISKEKLMKKQVNNGKIPPPSETSKKVTPKVKAKFEINSYEPDIVRTKPTNDSKVEEIRISRPRKKKEVIPVEEKDPADKVIDEKKMKKRSYDWFEGTDDLRYEIDKIDEEGEDKWFEGVEDLKDKIDEKVKKKDKKKKDEEEESY